MCTPTELFVCASDLFSDLEDRCKGCLVTLVCMLMRTHPVRLQGLFSFSLAKVVYQKALGGLGDLNESEMTRSNLQ